MEIERERNIRVWLLLMCPPTRDLDPNSGMCPAWESNWRPFGSQISAQSTEPNQPGLKILFLIAVQFHFKNAAYKFVLMNS